MLREESLHAERFRDFENDEDYTITQKIPFSRRCSELLFRPRILVDDEQICREDIAEDEQVFRVSSGADSDDEVELPAPSAAQKTRCASILSSPTSIAKVVSHDQSEFRSAPSPIASQKTTNDYLQSNDPDQYLPNSSYFSEIASLNPNDITLLNRLPCSSWAEDGEEISTASQLLVLVETLLRDLSSVFTQSYHTAPAPAASIDSVQTLAGRLCHVDRDLFLRSLSGDAKASSSTSACDPHEQGDDTVDLEALGKQLALKLANALHVHASVALSCELNQLECNVAVERIGYDIAGLFVTASQLLALLDYT